MSFSRKTVRAARGPADWSVDPDRDTGRSAPHLNPPHAGRCVWPLPAGAYLLADANQTRIRQHFPHIAGVTT